MEFKLFTTTHANRSMELVTVYDKLRQIIEDPSISDSLCRELLKSVLSQVSSKNEPLSRSSVSVRQRPKSTSLGPRKRSGSHAEPVMKKRKRNDEVQLKDLDEEASLYMAFQGSHPKNASRIGAHSMIDTLLRSPGCVYQMRDPMKPNVYLYEFKLQACWAPLMASRKLNVKLSQRTIRQACKSEGMFTLTRKKKLALTSFTSLADLKSAFLQLHEKHPPRPNGTAFQPCEFSGDNLTPPLELALSVAQLEEQMQFYETDVNLF